MLILAVYILLILCSFSCPTLAIKDVILRNFHGDFTKSIAEANLDAETVVVDNSTLLTYPLNLFATMINARKISITNTKIIQPLDRNIYASGHKLDEVHFANNEINEYPLIIFHNTTFEKIRIQSQPQVKIIPHAFASETKHLKYFQCTECEISTIEDGAFLNLDKLEDLDLQKNSIEKLTEETLKPLKNLKKLNLAENKITAFTTKEIKHLTKLEDVDLSRNPLKELNLLDAGESLPNLKSVSLIGANIPEAVIEEHRKKTNIRFITEKDNTIPH